MHSYTMKVVACQRHCSLNAISLAIHYTLLMISILCLILSYNHLMCLNKIISSSSVSLSPFRPESSIFYICMIVVLIGLC